MTKHTWYVAVNSDSLILAVYGSSLLDMANHKMNELTKLGPVELRIVESATRPRVGQVLP